jgi:3-oxoadipate enol-lactonase
MNRAQDIILHNRRNRKGCAREDEMQVETINSLRVHHAVTGDPDGVPLVFANSLGTDFRVWDRVLPLLPAGLRILRYDMRGHGLSDAPAGDYFMGDLVADAAGLMEATGFRGAVFVGLSIGGVVAQGLAAERPDLVRAAVLSNTAAKIGTEASWRDRIAAVRAGGIAAIADGVLEKWFTKAFHAGRADELALWRHMLTRTPLDGYVGCCAALAGTDLRDSTAGLTQRVLAIAGDADGSTPPDLVRETAESIAGARFEIIRGAGHIPCVEQPEATARLIAGFLKEQGLA